MRLGEKIMPQTQTTTGPVSGVDVTAPVGKPVDRVDGKLKVTGHATYAAEAPIKGCVHAVLIESTISRGETTGIDTSEAEKSLGVLKIITEQNAMQLKPAKGALSNETRLPLSDTSVSYGGQYVAMVVADTLARAQHAASLVKFKYTEQKPAVHIGDPGEKLAYPKADHAGPLNASRGDFDSAIKAPDLKTITQTYVLPIETHNPIELSAAVATWDDDTHLTVWTSTQGVIGTRDGLASMFVLPQENVQIMCPYVGGGFGCKGAMWPHIPLAVMAARMVGKPVKLMLTRRNMFVGSGHRPALEQTLTLAANSAGKIQAAKHDTQMQGSFVGDYVESCGNASTQMLYDAPNFSMTHVVHRLNIATPTFMRAPGENPGLFALESAMDELAAEAGIDPLEFRKLNYAEKNPHTGMPWSSKKLMECYQAGADRFGWAKRNLKPGSMRAPDGRRMGWGMATATYPAHYFPATARIRMTVDNTGAVRAIGASATQDLGTGMWTVGTQMTASLVGLPLDRTRFELGDSRLPPAGVSGGSSSTNSVGQALAEAAVSLKTALLKLATDAGKSPLQGLAPDQVDLRGDRLVSLADTSKSEPVAPLIGRSGRAFVEGTSRLPTGSGAQGVPLEKGGPRGGSEDYQANQHKFSFQSFGAHFVEVMIDDPVPMVRVMRVVSVMNIGRVINPKTATSQVLGAVTMGIGQALMEETVYDPQTGRPVTDNLADYPVAVNPDIHEIDVQFVDVPDVHFNALGCRGVGEIGITGIAAAVANAVYHATGKRVRELPITPDKLL
jgi:xanthine dehydrogenase YagR molybdenum-binding subunit